MNNTQNVNAVIAQAIKDVMFPGDYSSHTTPKVISGLTHSRLQSDGLYQGFDFGKIACLLRLTPLLSGFLSNPSQVTAGWRFNLRGRRFRHMASLVINLEQVLHSRKLYGFPSFIRLVSLSNHVLQFLQARLVFTVVFDQNFKRHPYDIIRRLIEPRVYFSLNNFRQIRR
nr:hypothetical protein [Altericroceibacterium indicum]